MLQANKVLRLARSRRNVQFTKRNQPDNQGGGGGTLIFSHIRRLGPFFGFKILNFNIFWGFQKNEFFLGVCRFSGSFLGVTTKLG